MNKQISITGIVQGVGFRPYIYQLASHYGLKGHVQNNTLGVFIEIEGKSDGVEKFLKDLPQNIPSLARIDSIDVNEGKYKSYTQFEIIQSQESQSKQAMISPDIAMCDACLEEMNSQKNRRHNYPLINCTECGPRYSITQSLPYDRTNISMKHYTMCTNCQEEYSDPLNRRYHAQPISCFDCGPTLNLYDNKNKVIATGNQSIEKIARMLRDGSIVAVKGIGGFHIMCNAKDEKAVSTLRMRKKRLKKAFAVMFQTLDDAKEYINCNELESQLLTSKEKPIVLVEKKEVSTLSQHVAPDINKLGVMLAYTPLQHFIFDKINFPLVATSANRSDEPIYRSYEEVLNNLANVVDAVLDIDREILNAVDDSIVQVIDTHVQTLRLGRGLAPLSIHIPNQVEIKTLAVGAQQKNSIALAFDHNIILSPYIGDLSSIESFEYFQRTVKTFERFYDFKSEQIVCDKHPEYMTTRWAKEQNAITHEVQHHYAHILACLFEHHIEQKVLAFSFDGTGFGSDGTIWGGEVMLCDLQEHTRIGHIKPFNLLGADKAIKEPKRLALSILFEAYHYDYLLELDLPLLSHFNKQELQLLHKAWQKGINSPLTSSAGRLFDIVVSLMDILQTTDYEGQSGLLLESLCFDENQIPFSYNITNGVIDIIPMIKEIVTLVAAKNVRNIPDRFINTLVAIMDEFTKQYPDYPIVFSGGVFQNKILLTRAIKHFKAKNRAYYFQEKTPVNDGGIALGQIAYAINMKEGI